MKKFLLGLFCATLTLASSAAETFVKTMATKGATPLAAATLPSTMVKYLNGTYDPDSDSGTADCYMIFTDNEEGTFDKYHGPLVNGGYVLFLDIYTPLISGSPIKLPAGTYTPSSSLDAGTYDPDYTYLQYYDETGAEGASYSTTGNITVEESGSGVKITVNVKNGSSTRQITFTGNVELDNAKAAGSVYEQIKQNLDLTLTGSWNVYDGNLYQSNTGAVYFNLYEGEFNDATGGMAEDGFSLALQVFGKLFKDGASATPDPGTYTPARNFNRYTFFPGMEVDYMGTTVVLGSYVKQRKTVNGTPSYAYSYLSTGTIEVIDEGNKTYTIIVDCVTSLGHTVKGKFTGKMPMVDKSEGNKGPSAISTLEDDVELDLEQHKSCYVWNGGVVNNCQTFLVDIGSPSGRGGNTEGDIIRIELVLPGGTQLIQEGNYTVMEEKYDTFYEPFTLGRGRWVSTSTGGTDLSGTRYMHFIEGRYLIMDHYAPAASGSVGITKETNGDYTFNIALMCDAQFHIDGTWTGPAELMYNPEGISAIQTVTADNAGIRIKWLDSDNVLVVGTDAIDSATLYNAAGMRMKCNVSGNIVNMPSLQPGIYILNINGKTVKIAKK